jgi:endoglycosylceramidase
VGWCALALVASALASCGGSPPSPPRSPPDAARAPADGPVGPLRAPGGPFLVDQEGRTVLLHGVNLVDKLPPYEVETTGTGPTVLTPAEAQRMAGLGFDVVRLGVIWKGLEPGTDPSNDPSTCAPGRPRTSGSGQFDAATFAAYLSRLDATIALLSRYGIYSLLDMHQDVYNEAFAGEGAPDWAVCTDAIVPKPVRGVPDWSINYTGPGVAEAYGHFWENDVVGDLQGEFDSLWARIGAHFRGNPWVIGYDPFNEPYGPGLATQPNSSTFDAELECFYTGRAHAGLDQDGKQVTCPRDDPAQGLIPRLEAADPTHLVAYEGNYSTDSGVPNHIGSMDFPNLVLNFHDYCFLHVPNGPEPPDFASVCGPLESYVFTQHAEERANDAAPAQPRGPAELLTEFGATTDTADLARITADADANLVGWTYWQWINYDDPTGSHSSALWPPRSATPSQLDVLSRTYATAVAGVPTSMSFEPATGAFSLRYRADTGVKAPTVIVVPVSTHYPNGYCARVSGGSVVSAADAPRLDVRSSGAVATVGVVLTAGRC